MARSRRRRRRSTRNPGPSIITQGSRSARRRFARKVLAGGGLTIKRSRRRKAKKSGKARSGRKHLTKRQRAARKAARTRARNKAARRAAGRKAARSRKRRSGRKGGGRRSHRRRRSGGKRSRRSPSRRRRRRARRRWWAPPKRTLRRARGRSGRKRRSLSRRGRTVWRRPSGKKLRRSLRRAGRNRAKVRRAWRRRPGRRVRAGLRSAYRGVMRGGRFRRGRRGGVRWVRSRRNPFTLGGMKETLITAGTFYLGYKGAKALSAFLMEKVAGSKLGQNATVGKVLTAGGGAVPPFLLGLGLTFAKKKLGAKLPPAVGKVIDAVVFGAFVGVVERLAQAYVAPKLPANVQRYFLSGDDVLYDASGMPITREWGRYAPVQGYIPDPGTAPTNGIGNYVATGELEFAPAGMGLLEAPAGLNFAPAGFGEYIPEPGPGTAGLGGLGDYVKVAGMGNDGSCNCPHCGAIGEVPSGSPVFRCWSCQQVVDNPGVGVHTRAARSIVGPMQRPGGVFNESIFGAIPAAR